MNAWQVMTELLRTVLIMSVAGSVIALILFALKPLTKSRIPKAVQYYLWILALVALLVPFSLFVSIPVNTPITPVQQIVEDNIKTNDERYEDLSKQQYNVPFEELETENQIRVIYESRGWLNNYMLTAPFTIGATILIIAVFQYLYFVWKIRRRRVPARDTEIVILNQLHTAKWTPRLYRSHLAPTPMLIGAFRPVIMLPDREYSNVQLQNILLHELIHLQRHDIIIKWFSVVARSLHWFNPIAYFVCREIDRACELACDEAVIKGLDTDGKQSYGDTLIAMAADTKNPKMIVSTTMCEEKKTLKERLGAIMKHKRYSLGAIAVSSILVIAVLCTTIVLSATTQQKNATDALFQEYRNEAAVAQPTSIVTEVDLDDGSILLIYYNANGNICCAVMEKSFLGYNIASTSGEQAVEGTNPVSIMASGDNKATKWLAWGILRDDAIATAMLYGQKANILEANSLRLFYVIGDGEIPDDDYLFYDAAGKLVWEISQPDAVAPQYSRDELLSIMHEKIPPDGLTLEITGVTQDDAEFLLTNMTESIVEYGYANKVEQYVNGKWKVAISETKEIFPENSTPLQPGEQMYGMTGWVRDNTILAPGTYRYLLLVIVKENDLPDMPVVLEASFEITE